jgi:uncharacterized membrane protein (DUF485 family)
MTTQSSFIRAPEADGRAAPDDSLLDAAGNPDFAKIRTHPDFVRLRRRVARFVFPVLALFLCWYLIHAFLAAYEPEFMSRRVAGSLTVGLLLGLSQFGTTVVIMLGYARFARRSVDPQVAALRKRAGASRP